MLLDDLLAALSGGEGATAAELARRLGTGVEEVSFALFASHGRFWSDGASPPRWWAAPTAGAPARAGAPTAGAPARAAARPAGSRQPLHLYSWQEDALAAWTRRGARGVVEAVTGTGKTMVGVAAALDELERRGQVLVLVPTVELQRQWLAELEPRLPEGRSAGRLGSGAGDTLVTHDVLVAVVNSARAIDTRPIRRGGLLVADECHRYGSAVNRLALDGRFTRRLGLSATYARDDDGVAAFLDPYFGGTCFRLGYRRAVSEGITARFTVTLLGVSFAPAEQARYDELTELMRRLWAILVAEHGLPREPFEELLRRVALLAEGEGEGGRLARAYRQALLERRRLLAETPAKDAALALTAQAVREADRAIVFTQSIATSERACTVLRAHGLRAAAVHSLLSAGDRQEAFRRFASGGLDALAAPRVLDEGVDVPAADLGIVVGASRSRRQMIQRMGRVLRRKADGRRARFAVLFVEGTVEDPRLGAHETFLEEVTDVADRVACFPPPAVSESHEAVLDTLRPSQP